jgi:STE24 endopeptidase
LIGWVLDYPYHRAVREGIRRQAGPESAAGVEWWGLKEYLLYNIRHHLLFVFVPVGIIIALDGVLRMLSRWGWFPPGRGGEWMLAGLQIACAGGVFLIAPLLVVRIWKTRRLPDGPLRRRLESLCERLGLRYRDILVWESGGVIANAGAMGLVGPVRYILLSDGILQQMSADRVEAIFAHEAGHIIHHHIAYFGLFAISSILLSLTLGEWVGVALGDWGAVLASGGALAALWVLGFGWISRRFERQSDVVAAWALGAQLAEVDPGPAITPQGAHVFASALEQVAALNGFPPDRFNWRHGPISWRVAYVLRLGATGGTRVPIDRLVGRLKRALWASLAAAMAMTASLAWL